VTVAVLLITHKQIGTALLDAATSTLGELPLATTVISVSETTDPDDLLCRLRQFISCTNEGNDLLVLTDLYGSTQNNIAEQLRNYANMVVVSGLNLPMLLKVMNYASLPLNELAKKALSGGKEGVIHCSDKD
jgi:mannose PTS system EIIA component